MIYLVMFSISLLFILISTKTNKKLMKRISIIIGLLLPCLMAGLRSVNVGTDTGLYINTLYRSAFSFVNFKSFLEFSELRYYSKDILYLFTTFIFAKNNLSFQLLLFLYEVLIIIPIYISLRINSKTSDNVVYGMLLFYLTFYNLSLNMVRQSIAISFIILSFSLMRNKKNLLSVVSFIIAFMFHDSAVFSIIIFIIYKLLNSNIRNGIKYFISVLLIGVFLFTLVFYKEVLLFVGTRGIYSKALLYLSKYSSFDVNYFGTLLNIYLVFEFFIHQKRLDKLNENNIFVITLSVINLIIMFMGTFISHAQRIGYYSFFLLLITYLPYINDKQKGKLKIHNYLLIVLFIVYWFVVIYINNSNETLPYVIAYI